jgi:hypothetical protein
MFARFEVELKWESGVSDEASQESFFAGRGDGFAGEKFQLGAVVHEAAGRRDALAMAPDSFGRVELGCVRRKEFQMHIRNRLQPGFEDFAFVQIQIVQNDHQRCAERPAQLADVRDQIVLIHTAAGEEPGEQSAAPSCRRDRQGTEHRHLFAVSQPVPENRSLADRRPGAAAIRLRQKAGFVEEDEGGSEAAGLFLIRGQSSATQASMASSFRSRARRFGFWTDQPSPFSNVGRYPTWYDTWNSRRINPVIRGHVHSCPVKPAASGPAASSFNSRRFCRASSFGFAPGALPVFRADFRRPREDFRTHNWTDRVEQPRASATRAGFQPSAHTSSTALSRTSSPNGSLPCVLIRVGKQIPQNAQTSI